MGVTAVNSLQATKKGVRQSPTPLLLTPHFGRYFSISVMLRWMKSESILPLSIPFESNARSII